MGPKKGASKTSKAKSTAGRKKTRNESSSDDEGMNTGRMKFEDFDVAEAIKDVEVPETYPSPPQLEDSAEELAMQVPLVPTPPPPPPPPPAPVEVIEEPPVAAQPQEEEELVALATLEALDVDRKMEATNGLLKEPAPPAEGIARVTKEGESSPPMPTKLMQLLTA